MSSASPPLTQAQLVLHHLRPRFAWPAPLCSALRPATAFDVAVACLSPVFLDILGHPWTSLDGRSPWSDGLPPSPSSSSCRWFSRQGPTRRLGRTGTQRGR